MSTSSALLVVDIQPDFLPGGALPVEAGDEILDPVADLMRSDDVNVVMKKMTTT